MITGMLAEMGRTAKALLPTSLMASGKSCHFSFRWLNPVRTSREPILAVRVKGKFDNQRIEKTRAR